jgi:hypothetical protein
MMPMPVIPGHAQRVSQEPRAANTEPAALDSWLAPSARPGMTGENLL